MCARIYTYVRLRTGFSSLIFLSLSPCERARVHNARQESMYVKRVNGSRTARAGCVYTYNAGARRCTLRALFKRSRAQSRRGSVQWSEIGLDFDWAFGRLLYV